MRTLPLRFLSLILLVGSLLVGCIRIDPVGGFSFTAPAPPNVGASGTQVGYNKVNDNGPGDLRIVGYRLDDDKTYATANNGDGKLAPGETAYVALFVYNAGSKTISEGTLTPSISGDHVTVSTSYSYLTRVSVSGLDKGETLELSSKLKLVAAAKAPDNYSFTLKLEVSNYGDLDNYNRTVSIAFQLAASGESLTVTGHSMSGGNGDSSLNPGESGSLYFRVRNAGTVTSKGITLKATTNDTYVTLGGYPSSSTVGDIPVGSEASSSTGIQVSVMQGAPTGHVAAITVLLSNSTGREWSQTYSLPLAPDGAVLTSDSYIVSGGNGDQTIQRGETVYLKFRVRNTGTTPAKGVTVTADVSDPYISFSNSYQTSQYGDIEVGASSTTGSSFTLVVPNTVSSGHQFSVTLTLKNNLGSEWKVTLWLTAV